MRPEIYVLEAEVAGVISSMCAIHFGNRNPQGRAAEAYRLGKKAAARPVIKRSVA